MKDVWGHSGSMDQSLSELEIRHRTLAREAAVEGIVLLKNEGVLPLSTASAIALLGSGAEKTIKGGIGSGDVNNRENISIYQGMKEAGVTITSEDWLEDYEERYKNARNVWKEKILEDAKHVDNPFDAYASNPFILPEGRAIEAKDIADAKAAVYVLSRISGEGKDRRRVKGDYYLSEREAADLFFLNEKKIPVILLLNAGGPIELTDILENTENIKAILNISQPGQAGSLPSSIIQIIAEHTRSLSARGSINLPKFVTKLFLRARYPSNQSVMLAAAKITRAI